MRRLYGTRLFPSFMVDYSGDLILSYTKSFGKNNLFFCRGSYFLDLFFRKLSMKTEFLVSIKIIVLKCANEKMLRIYAGWIIAFMKYELAFWNFAFMNSPRISMRLNAFMNSFFYSYIKNTVSEILFSPVPNPTRFRFIYISPKYSIGMNDHSLKVTWFTSSTFPNGFSAIDAVLSKISFCHIVSIPQRRYS